jgi:hypothetical protein
MTAKASAPHLQRTSLVSALQEIIDALDRRVPQFERAGEMRIARDALVLRRQAVERLQELERTDDGGYDEGFVQAVMTDDGGA